MTDPHGVETAQAEAAKKTVTKRDVTAILAEFEPAAAPQKSAAEKERERRVERAQAIIRDTANRLGQIGVADGSPAEALAAFKALQTAARRAVNALNSLTAKQLEVEDDAPAKAPRTKRTSVPKPVVEEVTAAPVAEEPPADEEPLYKVEISPTPAIEESPIAPEEEDGEALVARLKAQRAGRSGPSAPASSDSRGETDPNLGDGF